jgi:hypothetical protein
MSEQEQPNETQINNEDKDRVNNAFFAKTVKLLPLGVLVRAENLKKEEVDVAITNEDVGDIYNAINGESPYGDKNESNE